MKWFRSKRARAALSCEDDRDLKPSPSYANSVATPSQSTETALNFSSKRSTPATVNSFFDGEDSDLKNRFRNGQTMEPEPTPKIRCNLCHDNVMAGNSSLQYHVWKRHCSLLPFACLYCSYRDVYASGVKSHIESRHREHEVTAVPPTEQLRQEYTDMLKVCFNGFKPGRGAALNGDVKPIVISGRPMPAEKRVAQQLTSQKLLSVKPVQYQQTQKYNVVTPPVRSADNVDMLECQLCRKTVTRRSSDTHIKSHLSQQIFKCSYCSYGSRTHLGDVRNHIEKTHPSRKVVVLNHLHLHQVELYDLKIKCFPTLNVTRSASTTAGQAQSSSSTQSYSEKSADSPKLQSLVTTQTGTSKLIQISSKQPSKPNESTSTASTATPSDGKTRFCHVCMKETGWRNWRPHVYSHLFKDCNLPRFECKHCSYRTSWSFTMNEHALNNTRKGHPAKCDFRDNSNILKSDFLAMKAKCFLEESTGELDDAEETLSKAISAEEYYGVPGMKLTSSSTAYYTALADDEDYDEGIALQNYYNRLGLNEDHGE